MSSYRPLTDVMILARSKTKYYGAYPAGFLHRQRQLLGVSPLAPVLYVCAGKVREYPFKGLGPNDCTLDLDPACAPDFCQDAREPLPWRELNGAPCYWAAVAIDRPYTEEDADHYVPGRGVLPPLNPLLKDALRVVPKGHRVAVLDYVWPDPGKLAQEVAVMGVGTGRNGRARWLTIWERLT